MDKKKVEYYKKRLVTTQDELLRMVTKSERDGREADEEATQDIADKAANSYTKEFLFHQSDENRRLLQMVNEALERVKSGTYGLCVSCQGEVQVKRLEAVPWATPLHRVPGKAGSGASLAHHPLVPSSERRGLEFPSSLRRGLRGGAKRGPSSLSPATPKCQHPPSLGN